MNQVFKLSFLFYCVILIFCKIYLWLEAVCQRARNKCLVEMVHQLPLQEISSQWIESTKYLFGEKIIYNYQK